MARIRTIKPEFFMSESVASLPMRVRLTFIGLWTEADDEGRLKDNAKLLKAALYPLDDDVTSSSVSDDLDHLVNAGLIQRYEVDGARFVFVTGFTEHQKINRPTRSKLPPPPGCEPPPGASRRNGEPQHDDSQAPDGRLTESSLSPQCDVTEDSPWKGKERKGKEHGTRGDDATVVRLDQASPRRRSPREPDHLFEAIAEACGINLDQLTKSARGALNNATKQLRQLDATPGNVRYAARIYRQRMPHAQLTPSALIKHWPQLSQQPHRDEHDYGTLNGVTISRELASRL